MILLNALLLLHALAKANVGNGYCKKCDGDNDPNDVFHKCSPEVLLNQICAIVTMRLLYVPTTRPGPRPRWFDLF